jgi:hypothetical protein
MNVIKSKIKSANLLIIILIITSSCSLCDNTFKKRICSPNGKMQAIILSRDCGATTSPSYFVEINKGCDKDSVEKIKNPILISDTWIYIEWKSNDTLIIENADAEFSKIKHDQFLFNDSKDTIFIIYK